MIVYKITNKVNGKIYIGQTTKSLEKRWRQHRHKSSGCRYLHHAIQKYGAENFTVEQIDVANDRVELNQKEQFWIQYYDCMVPNGYNLKSGGNTPIYSDASKLRMSKNHADVSGINNPRYGVHLSTDTRKKISDAHKGKVLSETHRLRVTIASPHRKCVLNIDTGEHFPSCRIAEKHYGLSHGTISRVCRNEGHTSGGFHWCYVEGGDADVRY